MTRKLNPHTKKELATFLKAKKSIVFVNQSSGYLMIDIIHAHLKDYDELVLLTGYLNPRNQPLDSRVKVHMLTSYNRQSSFQRLSTWTFFSLQVFYFLTFRYKRSRLYWVSNPPFTIFLAHWFRKRHQACLVYDVYPEALIQHGLLSRNGSVSQFWRRINRKVWSQCVQVFTIGQQMKELMQEDAPGVNIQAVPVWTDNSFLRPISKSENPFIQDHGLQNCYVVMYSGNLGMTHPLEVLVEVAAYVQNSQVIFLIIGEGAKKQKLIDQVKEKKLSNVRFLPLQPTEQLPRSLAAADLGVVTLGTESGSLSVPSKTFNLMSVGAPILVIGPEETELNNLLDKHRNGRSFEPGATQDIALFIDSLANDSSMQSQYREASLKASKHYTPSNANQLKLQP